MNDLFEQMVQRNFTEVAERLRKLERRAQIEATQDRPGNFTTGSVLFASSTGIPTQDNATLFFDDTNNRLGLGTATPNVKLHMHGNNANYGLGPHIEATTGADIYPLFQVLNYTHDNITMSFDAYYDGSTWRSSDAGSNFQLRKLGDSFGIYLDSGIAQGSVVSWDDILTIDANGVMRHSVTTAATNSVGSHVNFYMNSSGTVADNFGMNTAWILEDDGGTDRTAFVIQTQWSTAASATRKGTARFFAVDTTSREVIRIGTNGSAGLLSFFAGTPAVKQTSGANLTNSVTSGGTDDTITNWTNLSTYATDAAAIRNAVYQLARKLKQINDGLRLYGLFT